MPEEKKQTRFIALTEDKAEELIQRAAMAGIGAFRKEQAKAIQSREKVRDNKVKSLLENYKRFKQSLEDYDEPMSIDEKTEIRYAFIQDLMGDGSHLMTRTEEKLSAREEARKRTAYEVRTIEEGLSRYYQEVCSSPKEEDMRRYNIMTLFYFGSDVDTDIPANVRWTVEQIAEEVNLSPQAVYKDLSYARKALGAYLFGPI